MRSDQLHPTEALFHFEQLDAALGDGAPRSLH
jgi:hypothetical protein